MIKKGDICIIDPDNKAKFAGKKIVYLKVIKVRGIFPRRMATGYMCGPGGVIINENPLVINTFYLAKNNSNVPKIVIRHPEDTPIINNNECEVYKKILSKVALNEITQDELKAAQTLLYKLEFYKDIYTEY
jgi:hypothetical protein